MFSMEIIDIKKQIRQVFDPLANRLSLRGPIEMSLGATDLHFGYLTEAIGVEITVDMSDFFVYALIFRPEENTIPIGYNDSNGVRQKLYLQQALKELGIDVNKETLALQRLGGDWRNCDRMIEILAKLVDENWTQISLNPKRFFLKQQ